MRFVIVLLLLMIIVLSLPNCKTREGSAVNVTETPHEKLSAYGFFTGDLAQLQPNEGVVPYDLNSPLFSDYAHKARFVWLPVGSKAQYTAESVLEFPIGTVLIKNFYYEHDEREAAKGRRILETRLLINRTDEWEALGYIWNAEQTEAYYETIGGIKEVNWIDAKGVARTANYIIPNKNQCKNCHANGQKQQPIGPKVRNLNKSYTYSDGEMNQLDKWSALGLLEGFDPTIPHQKAAVWDDPESGSLHDRAMSYLDINCGHCHHPQGAANTSGLHLVYGTPVSNELGVYKATVSAGAGTGGFQYSIVPGHPDESILLYRMKSTNPGAMMPELGRLLVHEEGVALIRDWIKVLEVPEEGASD